MERTKYGLYQDAVSLCQKNSDEEKWKKAIFWVFDAPNLANKNFEVCFFCVNFLRKRNELSF
jgi:hypothetical protein